MRVVLASSRGFCFGVEDAIETAEGAIAAHGAGRVVALGPVVHNEDVVAKLERAGLGMADNVQNVDPAKALLIRSHGATPATYDVAKQRGLGIVDATCVLVKKAQDAVRRLHEEGYHVVLIGDANHPEVKGVIGYAPDVTVIDETTDIDAVLPFSERLGIIGQTTLAPESVADVIRKILLRPFREIKVINTLCLEVIRRQEAAVAVAREVDVMFVLGGADSANTAELARLCREAGCDTHHIERWDQFEPRMVAGKQTAGVTAGASTPEWIVTDFAKQLEALPTG